MAKPPSLIFQVILLTGLWLIVGFTYMARTHDFERAHDFKDHLIYTRTMAFEGRLPTAGECLEAGQPPLFYWIAGRIDPASRIHPFLVRTVSLILGAMSQLLIFFLLRRLSFPAMTALGVTFFVSTTPQFVFVFTTYSNDALSTFLALAVILLSLSALAAPGTGTRALLFAAALAGVYTKATVFNVLVILSALTAGAGVSKWLPWRRAYGLFTIYAVVMALFMPMVWWRILRPGLDLFRFMDVVRGHEAEALRLPIGSWHSLLTLPGLSGEWGTPFTAMWRMSGTKKSSLLSYLFTTSVYGEFEFTRPGLGVIWSLVGVHAFLTLGALGASLHDRRTRIALSAIALATASYVIVVVPIPLCALMDFRYVTWSLSAWAVLYAGLWERTSKVSLSGSRWLVPGATAAGILLHVYFLFTAQSLT